VATSAAAGSSCPPPGADPGCAVSVAVLVPALAITKTALTGPDTTVLPGDRVGYRITVVNTGGTAYAAASFADDLTGVLDDAAYTGDAAASAGTVSYGAGTLSWAGPVAVGATVTVTYSVLVTEPSSGDGSLDNVVSSAAAGSNCPDGSVDPGCRTRTAIVQQYLTLTDLTGSFTLAGPPGVRTEQTGAVTLTVSTNSAGGYTVVVRPDADVLSPAGPGNPDRIPVGRLETRGSGTDTYRPLAPGDPLLVHSQDGPSAPGGDTVSSDYAVEVPFVRPDTYSVTLTYLAATQ
jgi:hypothetical protein